MKKNFKKLEKIMEEICMNTKIHCLMRVDNFSAEKFVTYTKLVKSSLECGTYYQAEDEINLTTWIRARFMTMEEIAAFSSLSTQSEWEEPESCSWELNSVFSHILELFGTWKGMNESKWEKVRLAFDNDEAWEQFEKKYLK